jgi:hypothetical protein
MKENIVKRFILSFLVCSVFVLGANALGIERTEALKKLGLSDDQIKKVTEINQAAEKDKKDAALELNILRAQLEKMLADPNPDMKEVEKLLRNSADQKVKSELAEITRRVEIRKTIGEEKWTKLVNFLKRRNEAKKEKKAERDDDLQ